MDSGDKAILQQIQRIRSAESAQDLEAAGSTYFNLKERLEGIVSAALFIIGIVVLFFFVGTPKLLSESPSSGDVVVDAITGAREAPFAIAFLAACGFAILLLWFILKELFHILAPRPLAPKAPEKTVRVYYSAGFEKVSDDDFLRPFICLLSQAKQVVGDPEQLRKYWNRVCRDLAGEIEEDLGEGIQFRLAFGDFNTSYPTEDIAKVIWEPIVKIKNNKGRKWLLKKKTATFLAKVGTRWYLIDHTFPTNVKMKRENSDSKGAEHAPAVKVKCRKCQATILDSTAKETGGLCMPCHKGFR